MLAFRDWVFRHLCFGGEMFREGVEARLVVSFVVGRQGAVEEPEVVSSTDERCSKSCVCSPPHRGGLPDAWGTLRCALNW